MIFEKIFLNDEKTAYFTACIYEKSGEMKNMEKRPAVVVCPGGGYYFTSDREADPVATVFSAAGYNTFILRYSIYENARFPRPLSELSRAIAIIRERADEWGIIKDKIAVCGFSAGGHLALSLGVHNARQEVLDMAGIEEGENKPNALILGYPVVTPVWMEQDGKILPQLCKDRDEEETMRLLKLDDHVKKGAPPMFIFHTTEDATVPVTDSLTLAAKCQKEKVPFELHVFQKGGHGLSVGTMLTGYSNPQFAKWTGLALGWLSNLFEF